MSNTTLKHKIDFAVSLRVTNANPNGNPLDGNRPRVTFDDHGEITDVAIKRKIRDRLMEVRDEHDKPKHKIFVQTDDRRAPNDEFKNLRERADAALGKVSNTTKPKEYMDKACKEWLDVRAFGQVFPFKAKRDSGGEGDTGVSIPIRGPVSIQSAFSLDKINVVPTQITKGTSLEGDGVKRASDQMGMKYRLEGDATYVLFGSINPQLAERTGFSDADAKAILDVLPMLFENDESTARPSGSMRVVQVVWLNHGTKSGKLSSAKVHDIFRNGLNPDGTFGDLNGPPDLPKPVIIPGF